MKKEIKQMIINFIESDEKKLIIEYEDVKIKITKLDNNMIQIKSSKKLFKGQIPVKYQKIPGVIIKQFALIKRNDLFEIVRFNNLHLNKFKNI